jgi:hypothetical protein
MYTASHRQLNTYPHDWRHDRNISWLLHYYYKRQLSEWNMRRENRVWSWIGNMLCKSEGQWNVTKIISSFSMKINNASGIYFNLSTRFITLFVASSDSAFLYNICRLVVRIAHCVRVIFKWSWRHLQLFFVSLLALVGQLYPARQLQLLRWQYCMSMCDSRVYSSLNKPVLQYRNMLSILDLKLLKNKK